MQKNRKAKQYDQRDADWQACMMASDLDYNEVLPEKLREDREISKSAQADFEAIQREQGTNK